MGELQWTYFNKIILCTILLHGYLILFFSDEGNGNFGESIKLMVFITQLAIPLLVTFISHKNLVPANTFHCNPFCKASDCMRLTVGLLLK